MPKAKNLHSRQAELSPALNMRLPNRRPPKIRSRETEFGQQQTAREGIRLRSPFADGNGTVPQTAVEDKP